MKHAFNCCLALLLFGAGPCFAQDQAFYTYVDANGRLVNVPVPTETQPSEQTADKDLPEKRVPSEAAASKPPEQQAPHVQASALQALQQQGKEQQTEQQKAVQQSSAGKTTAPGADAEQVRAYTPSVSKTKAVQSEELAQGTLEFEGTGYVDSEFLIEKEFNLDDRKKFFSVPIDGRFDVVQRSAGVSLQSLTPTDPLKVDLILAPSYQSVPKSTLAGHLPQTCVPQSELKKASLPGKKSGQLSLWPKAKHGFGYDLVRLNQPDYIRINSFGSNQESPSYYWPLAVFLDSKGCMIEGAVNFFTEFRSETMLRRSALLGNLLVPENASYLLLTPLHDSDGLSEFSLSPSGELQLELFN